MWTAREILSMFSRCPHPGHLTATVPQTPRTSGPGGGCVMPIGQTPGGRAPGNRCRSARDRSWPNANARARPDSGITTPAHSPSAPADSTASRAHSHRRGQARHRVLASSSGVVVQRSGSCVQTPSGTSYRAVTVMSTFLQKALQVVASAAKAYRINHSDATVSSSACLAVLRLRFGELRV